MKNDIKGTTATDLSLNGKTIGGEKNFKMRFKGIISAIGILLSGSAVYAQTIIDTTKTKQLEEVMVTANKREESIIKVNTSVTSLSSKK